MPRVTNHNQPGQGPGKDLAGGWQGPGKDLAGAWQGVRGLGGRHRREGSAVEGRHGREGSAVVSTVFVCSREGDQWVRGGVAEESWRPKIWA